MSTIRVTKSFGFETGHALYGYDGLCKNVHGHSYKLYVTVVGRPIDDQNHVKNGMVIDFKDLKPSLNPKSWMCLIMQLCSTKTPLMSS